MTTARFCISAAPACARPLPRGFAGHVAHPIRSIHQNSRPANRELVTESGSHAVRIVFPFLPTVMMPRWGRLRRDPGRIVHRTESFSVSFSFAVRLCHYTNRDRQKRRHDSSGQFSLCRVHCLPFPWCPLPPLIRANFPETSALVLIKTKAVRSIFGRRLIGR